MYNKLLPQYDPPQPPIVENQDGIDMTVIRSDDPAANDAEQAIQNNDLDAISASPAVSDGAMSDNRVDNLPSPGGSPPSPGIIPGDADIPLPPALDMERELLNEDKNAASPAEISAGQDML